MAHDKLGLADNPLSSGPNSKGGDQVAPLYTDEENGGVVGLGLAEGFWPKATQNDALTQETVCAGTFDGEDHSPLASVVEVVPLVEVVPVVEVVSPVVATVDKVE